MSGFRWCARCSQPYAAGTFSQHIEGHPPRNRKGQRVCTLCDRPYPVGGYGQHRVAHVPLRPPKTAVARDAERATAIALDVALGVRSLQAIADDYGLSRERIRQIAKREGVSRQHKPRPGIRRIGITYPCKTCAQRVPSGSMRAHRLAAGHSVRAGGKVTQIHLDLMREFYDRGLGYVAIGRVIGLPHMTVKWHLLHMDGFVPHPSGHYQRYGVVPALRRELAVRLARLESAVA
jgi:hypothetical protein